MKINILYSFLACFLIASPSSALLGCDPISDLQTAIPISGMLLCGLGFSVAAKTLKQRPSLNIGDIENQIEPYDNRKTIEEQMIAFQRSMFRRKLYGFLSLALGYLGLCMMIYDPCRRISEHRILPDGI